MADKSLFRPALARMMAYAPGEQPPPGKYIKLNTNENPYPPPPAVVDAIRVAAGGPLNRYPDPMATAFRRVAAEQLNLPGPEWVLAGNGSDEILTLLLRGISLLGTARCLPRTARNRRRNGCSKTPRPSARKKRAGRS